jgi:hypothetical protein
MAHNDIIAHRYWNTNGSQVAIVAVEGGNNGVAAYIGGTQDYDHEEDTIHWVVQNGAKLTSGEATRMLSDLSHTMDTHNLHYRE